MVIPPSRLLETEYSDQSRTGNAFSAPPLVLVPSDPISMIVLVSRYQNKVGQDVRWLVLAA
jgi:hypothetical protein